MTELVDGSPSSRGVLEKAAAGGLVGRAQVAPMTARGRDVAIVLALTFLFPGCGHAYAARWARASLWSLFFAAGVFPAALFAFAVWSSFSPAALPWIAFVVLLLVLACAAGPVADALKGRLLIDPRGNAVRPASLVLLAAYAAAFTVLLSIEAVWFVTACLDSRTAETSRLEPALSAGHKVTVLLSRYIRPVHGDVILCRMPDPAGGNAASLEVLARVLARPEDTVQARDGKLIVDGIELDLLRNDQAKALEKAGRAHRRRHILPGAKPPSGGLLPGSVVDWTGSGWGPYSMPRSCWLVVLDVGEMDVGPDGAHGRPAKGVLIAKEHLLGRAITR